jgi:hypothetical protein
MQAQTSPLAELKDIHLPEPTMLWPPAIGWWILLVVIISVIIALVIWRIRRWRLSKAKRNALAELSNLTQASPDWPQSLQTLMRRLTISYFEQAQVAHLHGQQWVQFLVSQLKPAQQEQCKNDLQMLVDAQYKANIDLNFEQQAKTVKYWITNALPPKRRKAPTEANNINEAQHNV